MDPAAIAEDAMAYLPGPRVERDWSAGGCLTYQPGPSPLSATVSAVRTADASELEALVRYSAEWFAARGRTDCYWFVTPATTPADAGSRLASLGLTPWGRGTAMTMTSPPPAGPDGVDIREVEDVEAYLTYTLLTLEAGSVEPIDDAAREAAVAANDAAWRNVLATNGRRRCYLAFVDGEPAAAGGMVFTEHGAAVLAGGATAPAQRGRGLYRALVRHRWDVAAAEGVPALVTQASDESRPILAALGFATVAELDLLRQPL